MFGDAISNERSILAALPCAIAVLMIGTHE